MAKVRGFIFATFLLLFIGLVMVFSGSAPYSEYKYGSSFHLFFKQLLFVAISIMIFIKILGMDISFLNRKGFLSFLYIFTVILLLIPFFLPELNHTRRWIYFRGFSFQPSEFAKLTIIIIVADILSHIKDINENIKKSLLKLILPLSVIILLIYLEPDFGTVMVIMGFLILILFFKGIKLRYLFILLFSILLLGGIYLSLHSYAKKRVVDFIENFGSYDGSNFQTRQSLIAIGHSGFWGNGPGGSEQKLFFLPAPYSDFIFSLICEEMGFPGAIIVLLLYLYIVMRGVVLSMKLEDSFYSYIGLGICIMLFLQVFLNVSMTLNLIPTKGIALPLISMGGSSLIVTVVEIAILCNLLLSKRSSGIMVRR